MKVVKPEKNSIFLKKGKTVISVENRKFSRSRMTKWIAPLNSRMKQYELCIQNDNNHNNNNKIKRG